MAKIGIPLAVLTGAAFVLGAAVHGELQSAQDQSYWTITRVTMPLAADRDSLRAIMKESAGARAEVRKNGISRYWLFEQAGGSGAQVLVLTRYPSWAAIQDTTLSFTPAIYRRTMPDSAKRLAWIQRWQQLMASMPIERSLWREFAGPDH
ncbi:MAG: hypothetical protein ABIZ96_08225 [Gemmatimonadales bacterium]